MFIIAPILKFTQNEFGDAEQAATGSQRPEQLTKPYSNMFQQLINSVAEGGELSQSVFDRLGKNAKMLTAQPHLQEDREQFGRSYECAPENH